MTERFSEVAKTGYLKRITNSIGGVVFGVALFFGSFFVLYWNEGRVDLSGVAKNAIEVDGSKLEQDSAKNGDFVYVSDTLTTKETIGDNLYLKPGEYIALIRTVEMYSWEEQTETETNSNLGGSESTETTYTYNKVWSSSPQDSSDFRYPEGHQNPAKSIDDDSFLVSSASIGVFSLNIPNLELPNYEDLRLNEEILLLDSNVELITDKYIYLPSSTTSMYNTPQIGDLRISYQIIPDNKDATVFGKLNDNKIETYTDEDNNTLYRIFFGSRDQALSELHSEYTFMLWIFRLVGFLMMWIGMGAILGPISVIADFIPLLGSLSKALIGAVTFGIALVLSVITIVISMLLHNLVLTLIVIGVAVVVIILAVSLLKGRSKPAVVTK